MSISKLNKNDHTLDKEFDFSIRTFNVYADIFTDGFYVNGVWQKREKIPEFIEWKFRYDNIVKEMLLGSPSVIALQEVQPDAFKQFEESLKQYNYEGIMPRRKQYGNAIFYDTTKLKFVFRRDGSRISIAQFEHVETKKNIFVCNCHLEGHPLLPHVRFSQIKSMFKHCMKKKEEFLKSAIIICGDFNETHNQGICHLLQHGKIDPSFKFRNTDLSYSTKGNYEIRKSNRRSEEEGDNLLRFKNSYLETFGNDEYQNMWTSQMEKVKQTVDFIFYNEESFLKLSAVMKILPEEEERSFDQVEIPSEVYPSDHFPLFAGFDFV